MTWIISNLAEMEALGIRLGESGEAGNVLVLNGDLGAGKTTLAQSIGKGLGIQRGIKSPTYTIIREYTSGRLPLYHMDVYRVDGGADELGLDEYFHGDGITVVEWGELISDELPEDRLVLQIDKLMDPNQRQVTLTAYGPLSEKWRQKVLAGGEK